MHWFGYDTPCAVQAQDTIVWNSGAMVIKPETKVFNQMMDMLPNVTRYDSNRKIEDGVDPFLNGGYSDQE